jgi:hypothetical protein
MAEKHSTEPREIDHEGTDTAICPYCGYNNGDGDGDGPPSGEVQCYDGDCNKRFFCEPSYSVSFHTKKIPCLNGEADHAWDEPYHPWGDARGMQYCRTCDKSKQVGDWDRKVVL